jgi:crossover junction endodeoxyribonuclease RuvC
VRFILCKCKLISWDVGYVNHGLAVFNFDASYIKLIHSEYLRTDNELFAEDLHKAAIHFQWLIDEYNPDVFVYEKPVFVKGDGGSFLNQVLGVVTLLMYQNDVPIVPYTATQVKKQICGKGKATKKDIEKSINKFLNIDREYERDHESDAVAIGLTHWMKQIQEKQEVKNERK